MATAESIELRHRCGQVIANLQHVIDEINGRRKEHELCSGFKKFPVSEK